MIKINLLPFRAARKKENIRKEISIYLLSLVFLIMIMAYLNFNSNNRLNALMAEEKSARKELAIYEKNNRLAAQIKAKIKAIKKKLGVIRELEQKKGGPLNLLKEIAFAVPLDRLWLESTFAEARKVIEAGGIVKIDQKFSDASVELVAIIDNMEGLNHYIKKYSV